MADPIGIVGTALGVVSLGLQVYNNLKTYVDDFKSRDEHVSKVSRQLDLLHGSLNIINTAIPAIEDDFRTESAVVVSGLQASEASLKSLAKELQKHGFTPAADFKGKAMEFKKRLKFPFAVPELDKLARDIDRINSHLLVALQGLGLNIQSATANSLADVKNTARTTAADITSIIGKLDGSAAKNAAFQESLTKQIQETTIPRAESLEAISLVRRIENSTSSTTTHLTDLVSDHQLHRRQTGKLEERISELREIIVQQSQRESPAEQFFHMLMSKPDFMKSWQDAMTTNKHAPLSGTRPPEPVDDPIFGLTRARQGQVSYACGCRHRRRQTRSHTSWSKFVFFDETIVKTKHEPGCPKYSTRQTTRERTVGITYTGLHRLLRTAVAVSLRQVRGAGGTSISPMFRYYATVDARQSPAFRIVGGISLAIDSFYYSSKRKLPISECEARAKQILYYGVSKLRRVFEDRLSSPTDLDKDGATLLAYMFQQPIVYFGFHGGINALQCLGDLLLALLELDVPRESTASHMPETSLPFLRVLGDDRGELQSEEEQAYFKTELVPLLFPEDPSDQILPARGVYWLSPLFRDLLTKSRHVVEALDLDSPLFTALLTKDENMLRRALHTQAADVDTPTASGITAIHIATLWPRGLEIVLKTCTGINLDIKSSGYTPLGLAMVICADICVDPSRGCVDCPCAESVELLLEYGCFLSGDDIFLGLQNLDTPRIAHVLLDHIRRWRIKLTEIAYIYLSSKERESLGITQDTFVFDSAAPDVIRKLESHGISPSNILKLHSGDYRLSPPMRPSRGCSIYCELSHLKTAEQAFDLGFRDFDFPHSNGETTLSELARYHVDSRNIPFMRFIVYCHWLIDHGASLTRPMQWQWSIDPSEFLYPDEVPQHIIAHCLMASPKMRSTFPRLPLRGGGNKKGIARFNIMFQCHSLDIADGCKCACSENEDGCEPLTTFLTSFQRFGESLEPIAGDFEKFYGYKYNKTELLRFSFSLLRCATFQELEIRHTCCNTLWRERRDFEDSEWKQVFDEPGPDYGEDFPYIRDEDEPLVAKLEELVAEFKAKFRTGSSSLPEFLKGYWRERMDQVKNEMQSRRLTQEERDGIVALGVEKWKEDADSQIADEPAPVKEKADLDPTEALFWIRKLESISS